MYILNKFYDIQMSYKDALWSEVLKSNINEIKQRKGLAFLPCKNKINNEHRPVAEKDNVESKKVFI